MINGRFIVPKTEPISSLAYTVKGGSVIKGYVISNDDEFSADGNTVYTVNAVNVVKATNQATLGGTAPNQTITAGSLALYDQCDDFFGDAPARRPCLQHHQQAVHRVL